MKEDTTLKIRILNKLMFVEKISYSELEKVTSNHDLFNYHLKELLKSEFITKEDKNYSLTAKGRQFVSLMEEDGALQKQFKVGMFINVVRKEKGTYQLLLHKRLKHPHYGYIGAVTGKLKWGQNLEQNMRRELMEEIGMEVKKYSILGVVREIFLDPQSKVSGDGVFFVIVVEEWEGEIRSKSEEGEYFWHDIDKILELDKIFRKGFEQGIPKIMAFLGDRTKFSQYVIENGTDALEY